MIWGVRAVELGLIGFVNFAYHPYCLCLGFEFYYKKIACGFGARRKQIAILTKKMYIDKPEVPRERA